MIDKLLMNQHMLLNQCHFHQLIFAFFNSSLFMAQGRLAKILFIQTRLARSHSRYFSLLSLTAATNLRHRLPNSVAIPFIQQNRSMFIQVQETPNPMTLKFVPGRQLIPSPSSSSESGSSISGIRTYEFTDPKQTKQSPLAAQLMRIDGVKSVLIGNDFLTVTKTSEDEEWPLIKPHIFATIMDYLQTGRPVVILDEEGNLAKSGDINNSPSDTKILPDDDEVVATIKELLETRIKPMVQEDGGDVLYSGFEDGVLKLRLQGSCTGCPSSIVTLRQGIKNMMQFYVPEVQDVVEVREAGDDLVDKKFDEVEKMIRVKRRDDIVSNE